MVVTSRTLDSTLPDFNAQGRIMMIRNIRQLNAHVKMLDDFFLPAAVNGVIAYENDENHGYSNHVHR